MSWSISTRGTKETVSAELEKQFAHPLQSYAGDAEGEEVAMIKKRALEAIDALDMSESTHYSDEIQVSANGSHTWSSDKAKPTSVSFSLSVSRVLKDASRE